MQIIRKSAILILTTCIALLALETLQTVEARALNARRQKRNNLPEDDQNYLGHLYYQFQQVFQASYRPQGASNAVQFAVATINRPNSLQPCQLAMNFDSVSSSTHNYLAYTPRPSPDPKRPPGSQQHSEIRIINDFAAVSAGRDVNSVYLVTHFSPCRVCTDHLLRFVRQHRGITFYIGYVERYQNEDTLNYFIQNVGHEPNVCFGQITSRAPDSCTLPHDELRRLSRASSCPVIPTCDPVEVPNKGSSGGGGGGGGCFPSTALVHVKNSTVQKTMKDLEIGDEVLTFNNRGQLIYSPIIAFLDRVPGQTFEFVQIETDNAYKLLLTSYHLIFTNASNKPMYASNIKPGNHVFAKDNTGSLNMSRVIHVSSVSAVGMYAPLTAEGTVIVDDVLVSCYSLADKEQSYIHDILFAPLQFLYKLLPQEMIKESQPKNGIHWYPRALLRINEVLDKVHLPIEAGMIAG